MSIDKSHNVSTIRHIMRFIYAHNSSVMKRRAPADELWELFMLIIPQRRDERTTTSTAAAKHAWRTKNSVLLADLAAPTLVFSTAGADDEPLAPRSSCDRRSWATMSRRKKTRDRRCHQKGENELVRSCVQSEQSFLMRAPAMVLSVAGAGNEAHGSQSSCEVR